MEHVLLGDRWDSFGVALWISSARRAGRLLRAGRCSGGPGRLAMSAAQEQIGRVGRQAPHNTRVRPELRRRLASVLSAWRPVESMAVMLRRRTPMTRSWKMVRSAVSSASLRWAVPTRKGSVDAQGWRRRTGSLCPGRCGEAAVLDVLRRDTGWTVVVFRDAVDVESVVASAIPICTATDRSATTVMHEGDGPHGSTALSRRRITGISVPFAYVVGDYEEHRGQRR